MIARAIPGLVAAVLWTGGAWAAADPPAPKVSRWSDGGLSIELAPLRMEPATAFFLNRGFPLARARDLARTGCVFRSSVSHAKAGTGTPAAAFDLANWRLRVGGEWRPYPTKERWLARFEKDGISKTARIAFRWATFPTSQVFQPGDQNWGMHVFGLPPGTTFDLAVTWRQGGERRETVFRDLKCSEREAGDDRQ